MHQKSHMEMGWQYRHKNSPLQGCGVEKLDVAKDLDHCGRDSQLLEFTSFC